MSTYKNMRIGVAHYPVPSEVEPSKKAEWQINKAAELGLGVQQLSVRDNDPDMLKGLRDLAASKDVALESLAAGIWGLIGPDADEARAQLLEAIEIAKHLGCETLRYNYGRGTIETSRFNKDRPLAEHMAFIADNLSEAGKIAADHGMKIAIESFADFKGKEWADIFAAVDRPNVGAMLDTANGITVFCDPNEDVQYLAQYAINAHLKDFKIVEANEPGRVPFLPVGCALGDGHLDTRLAVETLGERSPNADGMHLVIELAWIEVPPDREAAEVRRELFDKSIRYLTDLLETL